LECTYLREGRKRGRKNFTVAKLLDEQERRNSSLPQGSGSGTWVDEGESTLGGGGVSRNGGRYEDRSGDKGRPPVEPYWNPHGREITWESTFDPPPPSLPIPRPPNVDIGISPAGLSGPSTRSPQVHVSHHPALDEVISLDHVRYIISLFYVHVSQV
jgi:hypothetical protein